MTMRKLPSGRTVTAHRNDGLRKRCDCPRRAWPKCDHDWHFNFKYGDRPYRFSLDRYLGRRLKDKDDARTEAEKIRVAIRAGTFTLQPAPAAAASTTSSLTFAGYGAIFLAQCPIRKGKNKGKPRDPNGNDASMLTQLEACAGADGQPLGPRALTSITRPDLEAALGALQVKGLTASTRNKYLELVKLLSKWGRHKGYLPRPWFTQAEADDTPVLQHDKGAQRHRRVEPAEEQAILAHVSMSLQRLILAALETACRQGELLALQWRDVSLARQEFTVRDTSNKTGKERTLPISPKFRALLEMVRTAPDGRDHAGDAYVFGNAIGERVSFPQKAWEMAVLRAHGHEPAWTRTKGLDETSRTVLQTIDLTFHDLRHESGSRMLEAGWPLHNIQQMLGHANLSQTSTYLNATRAGLQDSMRRFGTTPLHAVAPTPLGEHPPLGNTTAGKSTQATVN